MKSHPLRTRFRMKDSSVLIISLLFVGLCLSVFFLKNPATREPASPSANDICERLPGLFEIKTYVEKNYFVSSQYLENSTDHRKDLEQIYSHVKESVDVVQRFWSAGIALEGGGAIGTLLKNLKFPISNPVIKDKVAKSMYALFGGIYQNKPINSQGVTNAIVAATRVSDWVSFTFLSSIGWKPVPSPAGIDSNTERTARDIAKFYHEAILAELQQHNAESAKNKINELKRQFYYLRLSFRKSINEDKDTITERAINRFKNIPGPLSLIFQGYQDKTASIQYAAVDYEGAIADERLRMLENAIYAKLIDSIINACLAVGYIDNRNNAKSTDQTTKDIKPYVPERKKSKPIEFYIPGGYRTNGGR